MAKTCITTAKDFELFKEECKRWVEYFGMLGWQVQFQHGSDEDEDNRAMCGVSNPISSRLSSMVLCKDWGEDEVSPEAVKMCGFHEVMELMLYRLALLALQYGAPEDRVIDETHHIIRTLENTIFQDVKP